jgi:hypothetical protein
VSLEASDFVERAHFSVMDYFSHRFPAFFHGLTEKEVDGIEKGVESALIETYRDFQSASWKGSKKLEPDNQEFYRLGEIAKSESGRPLLRPRRF